MDQTDGCKSLTLRVQLAHSDLWDECVFQQPIINIGRALDNDIILEEGRISRHHLRIQQSAGELTVTDLGSANGANLNGNPIPARTSLPVAFGEPIELPGFCISLQAAKPGLQAKSPGRVRMTTELRPEIIVHVQGQEQASHYLLSAPVTTIGRADDNVIVINLPSVSRHHAEIAQQGNAYVISDAGSRNGLFLEGERVNSHILRNGDCLSIGKREIELSFRAFSGLQSVEKREKQSEDMTFWRPKETEGTGVLNLKGLDSISIGRAADNRIVLSHSQVSLHHAVIERVGGRYRIKDFKSTGGTFVNGTRVEKEAWLKLGDVISIAGSKMVLRDIGIQRLGEEGLRLDIRGLNKWVSNKKNLLQNISLCIQPQEFIAIVGMSGSGKSTLMDAINGFRPATHGQVQINGMDLYRNFDLFRNEMGYVPQKDIVHQELTVSSALNYSARLRMPPDTSAKERAARIAEVLEDLDLTERKDLPIHKLSGGQLKRVSIGVELLTRPRLFFLDEPTSGLDPGTEAEMMRLLRKLADQGRTILLITHATKNVMMCDQVIFLARGGYMAYYGPPEEALAYFNQFRTEQERQQSDIEFDDIYKILNDEKRGTGKDWQERYLRSKIYQIYVHNRLQASAPAGAPAEKPAEPRNGLLPSRNGGLARGEKLPQRKRAQTNTLSQFIILSSRNIKIITQDKFGLALMLALAPLIGLMDFMWGLSLFNLKDGDATKIITMLFMAGLISILVGAMASVREIVKELDIYKRERAINLKLVSYILSKIWVGVVLSLYQAIVLVAFLYFFALRKSPLSTTDYGLFVITMFLGTLSGYLMGLCISAAAPNQNVALLLVIVILVPQFLFSGALLPLDLIPGGDKISAGVSTRWAFEAMVNITGIGKDVVNDPCWKHITENNLLPSALTLDQKERMGCSCMGLRMFESCYFPGIQDPKTYTTAARAALAAPQPVEPKQPTSYPSFTPVPSLTPWPTYTPAATMTPWPTQADLRKLKEYQATMAAQGKLYESTRQAQGDVYTTARENQGDEYQQNRTDQGNVYATAVAGQGNEYRDQLKAWGTAKENWQRDREKALTAAEDTIKTIFDNYAPTFQGNVTARWRNMAIIMGAIFVLLIIFQKLKDKV